MSVELNALRISFGRFLIFLLWLHVGFIAAVAFWLGQPWVWAGGASAILAGCYHFSFWKYGVTLTTQYLSVIALIGQPAILVFLLQGHLWQMDMHMYFFAMLALTIGWCDRRPIILAASAVVIHHLILVYLLPAAVFPGQGNLPRVLVHGAIVAFQTVVLVWICDTIVATFDRISQMSEAVLDLNGELEQRTVEAERANSAKSMFLANMSHEIRTPLNAVLGFCHLLQRSDLTARQEDYVSKISSSGTALLRLINDILDFSKNEAGKLSLESNPFNPHSVIEQQLQLVLVNARAKGLQLKVDPDADLPLLLRGDELRFGQVILNLVSNAVKFTEQGSVTVRTRILDQFKDQVKMLVEVTDTGIGMSKEQQDRLFSSFTQADNSMTRRFGGTGLGLAISRQIVGLMGGEISVESRPWEGTTFRFTIVLPVYQGQSLAATMPSEKVCRLRVIAVDDNPASRQIITEIFEGWSMIIQSVASGLELLECLRLAQQAGQPYDLALIDWKMPGMDGLEVVHQIRQDPSLSDKPAMIVVTGYGSDAFTAELERAGVAAYVTKPLETKVLLQSLHEIFDPSYLQSGADSLQQSLMPLPISANASLSSARQVPENMRGQMVLLVEDNQINREIASELLADAGLLVESCENGQEACEAVARNQGRYALVLMDLQMPVMDGLEATRQIRQNFTAQDLPILALTAHAYEDERQRCVEAGMNDHISKPVDPQALVSTLTRWLPSINEKPSNPITAATSVEGGGLPTTLLPFDLPKALLRLNGKQGLLRRLLLDFEQSQRNICAQIQSALDQGQAGEARRFSHTLKGVAGSLELPEVYRTAALLEEEIAKNGANVSGLLQQLAHDLAPAFAAVEGLRQQAPAKVFSSVQATTAARAIGAEADLEAIRDKILIQLNKRSLAARSSFGALAHAMGLNEHELVKHPVQLALERLDYEAARTELMALVFPSPEIRKAQ